MREGTGRKLKVLQEVLADLKIANLAACDDDQDDENDQRPEIIFIEQGGQGSLLSYSTSHQTSPGLVRRSLTS